MRLAGHERKGNRTMNAAKTYELNGSNGTLVTKVYGRNQMAVGKEAADNCKARGYGVSYNRYGDCIMFDSLADMEEFFMVLEYAGRYYNNVKKRALCNAAITLREHVSDVLLGNGGTLRQLPREGSVRIAIA